MLRKHKYLWLVVGAAVLAAAATTAVELTTQVYVRAYTVATLPAHKLGQVALVNDSATGCITGGGTDTIWCYDTGSVWLAIPTELLATGIVDGKAPVTLTTGDTATLGAATYQSGYTFNQHATAGHAVTYTLPATALGEQQCVKNSDVTGTGRTGVLTVAVPTSSYLHYNGVRGTISSNITSGGALGDAACFVATSTTDWEVYVQVGTWTLH